MNSLKKGMIKLFIILFFSVQLLGNGTGTLIANAAGTNQAKVMLDSYEIKKGKVVEGGTIELELVFKNIDSKLTAENITIDIEAADDLMYPVYGESNQIYIEKIEPKATQKVTVKLDIASSLKERAAVRINFSVFYYDKSNGEDKNETFILLPTVQECAMNVKNLSVADTATVGAKSLISVACANAGISEIYKAVMYIEGDVLPEQKKVAIGNIPVAGQQAFDCYVNFQKAGAQKLKIRFEYKDAEGHTFKTVEEEYTVQVSESVAATEQPAKTEEGKNQQNENSLLWKTCLAGALVIAVILAGVMIVRKRRR